MAAVLSATSGPSISGSLVIVVVATIDGAPRAVRFDPPAELRCILYIPDRPLATREMRAALPATVPFKDAIHNVGASSLAVAAMASGRLALLRSATIDRLHEPYRAQVFPQLPLLVAAARGAGALGACLSGAGSTVIAFAEAGSDVAAIGAAFSAVAAEQDLPGRVEVVAPRNAGATVLAAA